MHASIVNCLHGLYITSTTVFICFYTMSIYNLYTILYKMSTYNVYIQYLSIYNIYM